LNLLAVMIGFAMICGVLGILDILAQRELKKTNEALPKLFTYRWKTNRTTLFLKDPFLSSFRKIETVFPNLVEDHLPYIIADYFKIFLSQWTVANFPDHSEMKDIGLTPELLDKLERPIIVCLGGSTTDPFLQINLPNGNLLEIATGSWAEELARIMDHKKIQGTVFCGETSGFRTAQDLIKLLRDVLEIKPDIVI
jgi:hypothetical protein